MALCIERQTLTNLEGMIGAHTGQICQVSTHKRLKPRSATATHISGLLGNISRLHVNGGDAVAVMPMLIVEVLTHSPSDHHVAPEWLRTPLPTGTAISFFEGKALPEENMRFALSTEHAAIAKVIYEAFQTSEICLVVFSTPPQSLTHKPSGVGLLGPGDEADCPGNHD